MEVMTNYFEVFTEIVIVAGVLWMITSGVIVVLIIKDILMEKRNARRIVKDWDQNFHKHYRKMYQEYEDRYKTFYSDTNNEDEDG